MNKIRFEEEVRQNLSFYDASYIICVFTLGAVEYDKSGSVQTHCRRVLFHFHSSPYGEGAWDGA